MASIKFLWYYFNIYWSWYRPSIKFDIRKSTPETEDIKILPPLEINCFFLLPLNCLAFSHLEIKNFKTTSTCCLSTKKHVILGISILAKSYNWCGFNIWLWIALWRLAWAASLFIVPQLHYTHTYHVTWQRKGTQLSFQNLFCALADLQSSYSFYIGLWNHH